jgi:hypothetical protein
MLVLNSQKSFYTIPCPAQIFFCCCDKKKKKKKKKKNNLRETKVSLSHTSKLQPSIAGKLRKGLKDPGISFPQWRAEKKHVFFFA